MLFKKKKEEKKCCCSETESKVSTSLNDKNGIIVLGSRCKKCNELEENVKKAMISLEIEGEINHINDFAGIASFGVMSTPALVIDGKVVSYGKVLSENECIKILKEYKKQ